MSSDRTPQATLHLRDWSPVFFHLLVPKYSSLPVRKDDFCARHHFLAVVLIIGKDRGPGEGPGHLQ